MASDMPDHPDRDARPSSDPDRAAADSPPLLLRRDQVTLVVLAVVLGAWLAWAWLDVGRWGTQPVDLADMPPEQFGLVLDVNEATWIELSQLPGIGEVKAKAIVARRVKEPFRRVADLLSIPGIGPKTLTRVRPYLRVGVAAQTQAVDAQP
jgi:competence protein ComEA